MKFKTPRLELELGDAHPDVRVVLDEFADWCEENHLPEPVITCIRRTPEENARVNGQPQSWHLFGCGVDIRSRHLTPAQLAFAIAFLRRRCPEPEWELKHHDAGSGSHLHIARADDSWREDDDITPGPDAPPKEQP